MKTVQPGVYTKKDVAKRTGLTERTVHFYTDEGLVLPSIDNPTGRGTTRKYGIDNILDLLLIKEFVSFGLKLKIIKRIMDQIKDVNLFDAAIQENWDVYNGSLGLYLFIFDANSETIEFKFYIYTLPDELDTIPSTFKQNQNVVIEALDSEEAPLRFYPKGRKNTLIIDFTMILMDADRIIDADHDDWEAAHPFGMEDV